ncbi:MAG: branched-chain amino acid aminotransferase [Candidatus Thorarchaeota archaeon]|nr:MAG: branched-chain amino acid aminotransferase [Candidatus Thorarchaeota archaeon]
MKLKVELVPPESRKERPEDPLSLEFGSVFTDHMFAMFYADNEWKNPRIGPYSNLSLDPAALCLHYGQGIFEGLKSYRRGERVFLFRPRKNLERLNASAIRMVMPQIDIDFALEALIELLRVERDWIPELKGSSLYVRPTMIATEPKLGVRASHTYLYYVILSPVGPYFKEGFSPVKIMVSEKYVRAADGGVGQAKTIGNYAASLLGGKEAMERGYSQVMWLDSHERKYIEEAGTMNIFVLFDDELATPPLSGTILPGITRESAMQIAQDWGYSLNERPIAIDEVIDGIKSGKVKEIFGTGTAAIIAPIGELYFREKPHIVGDGTIGALSQRMFDELTGIQSGEREDTRGWVFEIE